MTPIRLSPYVNFQGQARAALEFYQQVLGGTLDLRSFNAQGVVGPAGPTDRIAYGRLEGGGVLILATDGHPNYPAQPGDALALAVSGTDDDRLTRIFHALAEGGVAKQPPTIQPWGAKVGWLTDQFGINWTVQIDPA